MAEGWRVHLSVWQMQETSLQSLGQEDPLEKEMATCPGILAWRIPWTEEPGGLQSTGSQRVGTLLCMRVYTHTQMPERLWGVQGREKVKARPCDRLKRQSPDRLWAKGREKFRVQAGNRSPCCALPTFSGSRVQVNLSHPEFPWQPGDKIS